VGRCTRFRLWHSIIEAYDNFHATWNQVRNASVAMRFEESTVETFSVSAEESSPTAYASKSPQQPRLRIGEQHGVFAVLVTVVRRRHRRPASALVARRTQVFTRVLNRNTVCDRDEHNVEPASPSLNRLDLVASSGAYDTR
jgi:hypothetical protein